MRSTKVLLTLLAIPFALSGFAQENPGTSDLATRQTPSVPDLRPEALRSNLEPKTFSVFSPLHPRKQNGSDSSGTQAIQRSITNDFSQEPANIPPQLPPPASETINELRPLSQSQSPGASDPGSLYQPVGDAKLGYSDPPQPPQSSSPSEITRGQPLTRRNQFDPRSRQALPTVNQTPPRDFERQKARGELGMVQPATYQQPANRRGPMPKGNNGIRQTLSGSPSNNSPPSNQSSQPVLRQLERYSVSNAPDPLPGKPVKLIEILAKTPASKRFQVVNKYWETYEEWALLINAAERLKQLNSIQVSNNVDRGLLETAKASAADMIIESEIRLKETQAALQRVARISTSDLLPLPSDQPWVKNFATHYDYFAKRRSMPAVLKSLDETMPKTLQLITTRAQTVNMASNTLSQTKGAYATRQGNISSLLSSVDLWYRANVDLIRSVGKYNRSTAQYAFNFRPNQPNQSLVKMLIGNPKPVNASSLPPARSASLPSSLRPQQPSIRRPSPVDTTNKFAPNSNFSLSGTPGNTGGNPLSTRPNATDFGRPKQNSGSFGSPNFDPNANSSRGFQGNPLTPQNPAAGRNNPGKSNPAMSNPSNAPKFDLKPPASGFGGGGFGSE